MGKRDRALHPQGGGFLFFGMEFLSEKKVLERMIAENVSVIISRGRFSDPATRR